MDTIDNKFDLDKWTELLKELNKKIHSEYDPLVKKNGYSLLHINSQQDNKLILTLLDSRLLRASRKNSFEKIVELLPKEYETYNIYGLPQTVPVEVERVSLRSYIDHSLLEIAVARYERRKK